MSKMIQSRYLEHSSPNIVYDWLEKNAPELRAPPLFNEKSETELMLLNRQEEIIDLGLALFSKNQETRNILFDRGDGTLQKAVLTNKDCGHFPALENLLKEENTEYLDILLTNTEDRLFLVNLFKKENFFSKVKKTYWLSLIESTARNKILEYPYSDDDSEWEDDIGTTAYATRLYRSVYGLFDMLDVNDKNVELLAQLVEKLPTINGFHLINLDVPKMMSKWKGKKFIQHSDYLYFYEHKNDWDTTLDKRFTKIGAKCWVEWNYVTCRTNLADCFAGFTEELIFRDSEDIALRLAYYRNENFNWNEEKTKELLENWSKYRKKDGYLFIENFIKNFSIYWNKEIREFVGKGFVLDRTYYADEYQERLKELKDNNPEEFIDNSQIEKIESIESEFSTIRNDINSTTQENLNIKKLISNQRTTSFLILFLLVVLIFR
ncbi:hypothetical protein THERMOT_2009 [Bathymodiolus thermophilus thioautotrophic gill symbiont]|uniref:hypothetical protein n=1 Tax=Bathymodiolus thermophilus thioautotrophic gill symbiont TaxID=2360 RepID=UPI00192BC361|nr:hypothetical protein [Bathymodiolus thermophilus thioautotrophic gill symbiont]CAB5504693.1 hypothetical protein THERMOT_2009 [Bathymodiolus thermophilus thioautotrophic gill symbiont]